MKSLPKLSGSTIMRHGFLGPALCAVGIALAVPSAADQLVVNGHTRTYVLERPATKGPQPTIVMLHGARGTGAAIAQSSKLGTLAPQQGFVAVFPDGLRPQWNFFLPGKELEFYAKASKAVGGVSDDGAFLTSLIADLVQRGIADPQRIYLAGESSGSLMALRMLCTNANLFAGAALLAPAMPERVGSDCHPSRPVPVLLIKGTNDEVLPYSGGLIEPEETFLVWGNDRLVSFLKQVNNHPGPPQSSVFPRNIPNTVTIDRWMACSGTLLTVYRVIDGPHIAPTDLNVGQVVLDFFSSPMRSSSCVASMQPSSSASPGANRGTNPGTDPSGNSDAAGTKPGMDPNSQSSTPGTATSPSGSPNTANADPGSASNTPGTGTEPNASNPNTSSGPNSSSLGGPGGETGGLGPPTDPNNPGNNTGGLGPPPDPSNPGSNTAGLGPPPDNGNAQNPTGALGPPPDPPTNNPAPPMPGGTTTVMLPPPVLLPPVYIPQPIPVPGIVCNPGPNSKPGNVCDPKSPNACNHPASTASASPPANPGTKSATPLILRPNPGTQATASQNPLPSPGTNGMIHLRPAEPPQPYTSASVASTGLANPDLPKPPATKAVTHDPPPKKNETEKKPRPRRDNYANSVANAAAAVATAAAIISIVRGFRHHGGGGGGGGGVYRGNPCHHR
jgi:polyhydroxybutyrate depolymerase